MGDFKALFREIGPMYGIQSIAHIFLQPVPSFRQHTDTAFKNFSSFDGDPRIDPIFGFPSGPV